MVSDLRSETKGSRFESSCHLCAEVSSPQQSPGQCPSAREAGGSGSEELENALPLPLQSCDWWMFVKENPDRKKKDKTFKYVFHEIYTWFSLSQNQILYKGF